MILTDRSAKQGVEQETVRLSIALSYVKAWQQLSPGPADLLGTVLPFLGAQDPEEDPAIRLTVEVLGDKRPDAHRKAWKRLKKASKEVHGAKVRHVWHRWNELDKKQQRCHADLVWTTEVRIDPVVREVELVFWPRLIEYLPAILEPLSKFNTQPPTANATHAVNGSLTGYCHSRIG